MIVISDTSPINYLLLIDEIELLPELFGMIIVPEAVWKELRSPASPEEVKNWIDHRASWVEVRRPVSIDNSIALGAGEREAISLAGEINADLLLVDDRKARQLAIDRGFKVAGTINILESAAQRDLIDLELAFHDLRQTNFRIAQKLLDEILERNR